MNFWKKGGRDDEFLEKGGGSLQSEKFRCRFSPQVTSKKNLPQNTSEKSVLKLPLKKFALLEEFDPIFPYQPTR